MVNVTVRRLLNGSTAALQLKRILNHTAWIISKASTHRTEKLVDKRRYFSYNSNFILSKSYNVDFPPLLPLQRHSRSDLISSSKNVKTQIIEKIMCSFHHFMTFDKDLLVSSDILNIRRNHFRILGWGSAPLRPWLSAGKGWIAQSGPGRSQVSQGLVREWGLAGERDWRLDWGDVGREVNVISVCCGEDITGPSMFQPSLWGATPRTRLRLQETQMSLLCRGAGERRLWTSLLSQLALRAGQADEDENKNERTFWSAGMYKNMRDETDDKTLII